MQMFLPLIKYVVPVLLSSFYVKTKKQDKVINALKYWCIHTVFSNFEFLFCFILNETLITPLMMIFYVFLIHDHFKGSVILFNYTALPLIDSNRELMVEKIGKIESYIYGSINSFRDHFSEETKKSFIPKLREIFLMSITSGFRERKKEKEASE